MEKIKILFLKALSKLFRLPIKGKITISELFYKKFNSRNTIVKMTVCDSYITLDLSEPQLRYIYFNAYEPFERKFLKASLRNGDDFIDVGANCGYLSAIALCHIGNTGRVFAFEPSPIAYKSLSTLVESSHGRFSVNQLAVSNTNAKKLKFYINRDYSMLSSTQRDFAGKVNIEELLVNSTTLSEFFIQNKILAPSFIKIDVEGGEAEVFEGLIPFVEKYYKPIILCEISFSDEDRWGNMINQIEIFLNLEYKMYDIDASGLLIPLAYKSLVLRRDQSNVVFATENFVDNRNLLK